MKQMIGPNQMERAIRYVRQSGIVKPRDIEALGVSREYLLQLHRQGKLNRPGRGIHTLPDGPVTERHSYAEVAKRVSIPSKLTFVLAGE